MLTPRNKARASAKYDARRIARDISFNRDITEVACAEMGIAFGAVRLGYDCLQDADGTTITGELVQHMAMDNWEARVHPLLMA